MHQAHFVRNVRNQYLHRLARLNEMADAMQIDPALLTAYLDRLTQINHPKEVIQAHQWQSAVRADLTD